MSKTNFASVENAAKYLLEKVKGRELLYKELKNENGIN
jgi:hypothetical protein